MSVLPWHDGNEQFILHLSFLESKSTFECRRKLWWFHCVELYLGDFEIWSCHPCLVAIIKRHHAVSVAVTDRRKTTFPFGFLAKLNIATTFSSYFLYRHLNIIGKFFRVVSTYFWSMLQFMGMHFSIIKEPICGIVTKFCKPGSKVLGLVYFCLFLHKTHDIVCLCNHMYFTHVT